MSLKRRIDSLEKEVESIEIKSRVKFFNSDDEYRTAFKKGKIRPRDICFIDDVPEYEENERVTVHHN